MRNVGAGHQLRASGAPHTQVEDTGSAADRQKTVKFKGKRSMRTGPTSLPAEQYKSSKAQLQTSSFALPG